MGYKMIHSVVKALDTAWDNAKNAQDEVDFDSKGQAIAAEMRKVSSLSVFVWALSRSGADSRGRIRANLEHSRRPQLRVIRDLPVEPLPVLLEAPNPLPGDEDCVERAQGCAAVLVVVVSKYGARELNGANRGTETLVIDWGSCRQGLKPLSNTMHCERC